MKRQNLFLLLVIFLTSCLSAPNTIPATETQLPPTLIPSTSTHTPTVTPSPTNTPRPTNTPTPLPDSWLQNLVYTEIPFDTLSDNMGSRWPDQSNFPIGMIDDPTPYYTKMVDENLYYYLQATVPAGDRVWIVTCFMYFTWCTSVANNPNLSDIQKTTVSVVWTDGKKGTAFRLLDSIWKIDLAGNPALNGKLLGNYQQIVELAEYTANMSNIQYCGNVENETHFCGEKGDYYFLIPVQPSELIPGKK